ncbi:MAG: hypothetical protein JOZ58_03865 [Acetobacteraceae bacterium]|nr:hypothetical protein [Acetobacteraceae bacterium]
MPIVETIAATCDVFENDGWQRVCAELRHRGHKNTAAISTSAAKNKKASA